MGLFDNLFGGGQAASATGATGVLNGLFSTSSKFATAPRAPPAAAAAAGQPVAAATSSDAGGKKKKRKHEGPQTASKQQQQQQQEGTQAAERAGGRNKKQQAKGQAAAAAATAAAAVAATAEAGAAEQQPKKKKKRGDGATAQQVGDTKKPSKEAQQAAGQGATGAAASRKAAKDGKSPEEGSKAGTGRTAPAAADEAAADERLPRTVFVGNLPAAVKRKALVRLFATCGAVESARLRSLPLKLGDPESKAAKMPRRGAIAAGNIDVEHSAHAYVVFREEAAVEAALKLNMTEFEGHHLRVDRAAPKAAKGAVLFDHTRSLFVGNLPLDAEDEELIRLFGAEGVEAVRVVRDARSGAGKGVAFVLFRSQDASRAALKQHRKAELRGRQLRLTLVKKGEGGAKGGKAAWQQGKGVCSSGGGGSAGKGGKLSAGKRKTGGKRPAVAARKAATKLKARPGDVQKR